MVDPAQIELTSEQRQRLAILAERTGKGWIELVDDWLNASPMAAPSMPATARETNGVGVRDKTLFEVLSERGILGCFDGPTDLSTNPKHMEGFGESRFPKNPH
jgi:hypothetical protein